ncbi:M12 family metallo-peptidase [Lewinella sp. 4G2]|uniref:zinc-dependent metalloprotease n=1 Tax=Lewinella sp. 4G2 TaxID=1803372 RepID=UPI0007B4AF33|nr:M12 family metallo-peptidase [Lewinella sp. 4G2]OAV44751.1 hypothetical protein A3850_009730 [Lewinella sp. 4G2]
MRSLFLLSALLCTALLTPGINAQSLRPAAMVEAMQAESGFEGSYKLFVEQKSAPAIAELDAVGADYHVVSLEANSLEAINKSTPDALQLDLPGQLGKANLVKANIFAEGFVVRTSTSEGYTKEGLGLHYRGVLANDSKSVVAISIFEGEVSGTISTAEGNFTLGKLRGKSATNHIVYNDKDLPAIDLGECATPDTNLPYSPKELLDLDVTQKDANNCVNAYLEIDNSIYAQRGAGTTSFITGLFNQVATLYANESLNLVMSEMFIWTSADPYNSGTSSGNLNAFRSNRPTFNGNIAHLISFQASGGVAYLDVLCTPSYAYGFSSIQNGYNSVPTYSWSVNVLAHEFGHNFGSQHTHACAWNGNGTAIDGCYSTEGNCGAAPIPTGGGTIMSYCHLTNVGVNFNLGFGTQPGNLMRNRAYNGSCLTSCSTGGGGGNGGGGGGNGGGDACTDTEGSITIITDYYPGETTWELTDASGNTVASGGPYSSRNTTYTEDLCLPDGCYDFVINDSYGDGICCAYGNGSYTINVDGTDVATGGNFGRTATENFCVGGGGDDGGDGGSGGGDGGNGGGEDTCPPIDFTNYVPSTYGGSQDRGTVTVINESTIKLKGNAWKDINLDYTVTPNTVMTFEFGAVNKGEIHGIGFDNNNVISSTRTFQLFGTQNWGIRDFKTYTDADMGYYKTYTIPVGEFFTGTFNRITFTNDHDRQPRNAEANFRNIRLYEGTACNSNLPAGGELIDGEAVTAAEIIEEEVMSVFPNPTAGDLNVAVEVAGQTEGLVRVIDLTGRTLVNRAVTLAAGRQTLGVDVSQLPAGTYFLRLETNNGFSATSKFNVAR